MKNRRFKEVVIKGKVEVIYTVLSTYTRHDGELMARVKKVANNIAPGSEPVPNDCGVSTIAVTTLQTFKEL